MLRRMLLRLLGFTTLSLLMFCAYLVLFGGPVRWEVAGPAFGLIALAYFLILFLSYRQNLRWLYSVRYELDYSSITFRQRNREPLRVARADIIDVEVDRDGLQIRTVSGSPDLFVPRGLARSGDEDVRQTLLKWTGSRVPPVPPQPRRAKALMMGVGGSLLVLLFANQLGLIIPLGLATLAYGIFLEQRMNAAAESDPGTVRTFSAAFTFLIFVIVMKACLVSMSMMLSK